MKLWRSRQTFRGGGRPWIRIAAALSLALPAVLTGDIVSPASSSLWYGIDANGVSRNTFALPSARITSASSLLLRDDVSYANPNGPESQAVINLDARLEIEAPFTHVEVSVWESGYAYASGSGIADVWYSAQPKELAPPPVYTTRIPVLLQGKVVGSGEGSGPRGGGSFGSQLTFYTGGGGASTWYSNPSNPEVEVDQVLWLPLPVAAVEVHLEADCNAWADPWDATSESQGYCSADADPTITLDQQAFDAYMGAQTYNLSDYFSIEYSPNLTYSTPEPSYLLPLSLALTALVALRRLLKRHPVA